MNPAIGLSAPSGSISSIWHVRRIDEAHLHPLFGHVEGFVDRARAHDVAPEGDAVGDRRGGDADMVEAAEFHSISVILTHIQREPICSTRLSSIATLALRSTHGCEDVDKSRIAVAEARNRVIEISAFRRLRRSRPNCGSPLGHRLCDGFASFPCFALSTSLQIIAAASEDGDSIPSARWYSIMFDPASQVARSNAPNESHERE